MIPLPFILLAFAGQAAEPVPKAAASETIPVYACIGVPPEESTPARYRELSEAGFTTSLTGFPNLAQTLKALDAAKGSGVGLFIMCPELKRDPATTVRAVAGHPALAGYHLVDEPAAAAFAGLAEWQKAIQALDAAHPCYVNLLPIYATPMQLSANNYKDYVDQFVSTVQPPLLSFDNYPTSFGRLEPHLFTNLEIISAAARGARIPFWGFYQTVIWDKMPPRTLAQLRLECNSNLVYGAQCIQAFTYWTPNWPGHRDAPIGQNGKRSAVYDLVRQVNGEIRAWSRIFKGAEILDVTHTGKDLPSGTRPFSGKGRLARLDAGDAGAVVSFLRKGARDYVAILNKDLQGKRTFRIGFDDQPQALEVRRDEPDRPVAGSEFTVDPGDLLIFQVSR